MPFDPIVMGTRCDLVVSLTPAVDMTLVPVTVLLDSPRGGTPVRRTLRYLNATPPAGADGVLEPGNLAVRFVFLPAYTATQLSAGNWQIRILIGKANLDQVQYVDDVVAVVNPSGGPAPTTVI